MKKKKIYIPKPSDSGRASQHVPTRRYHNRINHQSCLQLYDEVNSKSNKNCNHENKPFNFTAYLELETH